MPERAPLQEREARLGARTACDRGVVTFIGIPRNEATTMKFHIQTWGCQMNDHDGERLSGLLVKEGFIQVSEKAASASTEGTAAS